MPTPLPAGPELSRTSKDRNLATLGRIRYAHLRMRSLRGHVRLWAIAWLLMQATALSAFVPRDCCASHHPAANVAPCHEEPKGTPDCVMRRSCQAPTVFTIFASPGILPSMLAVTPDAGVPTPAPLLLETPLARSGRPDPRPPRA